MVEHHFYDARLVSLTEAGAVYEWQGKEMRRPRSSNTTWLDQSVGKIGVLVVNSESGEPGYFRPYIEQGLRRAIELDKPDAWFWRIEYEDGREAALLAKPGMIPGIDGAIIEDETEPVTIDVPPEFFDLCRQFKQEPETILRGFIADACGLMNYVKEPREDGYSSNGSDERTYASDYIERAWAPFRDS